MKKITLLLTTLMLTGCVSNLDRQNQQAEINRTTPMCYSQKQCDGAWSAARQWVNLNCAMKIQNYSSDYIETYNSVDGSTQIACQVTKNPLPNGGNAIALRVSCANMFGCVPDQYQAIMSFNKNVSEYMEQFSPVKMGFMASMADSKGNLVTKTAYSAGLYIKDVSPNGTAYKAGLRDGDVITSVGSDSVRNSFDLTSAMEKYHAGDNVKITFLRNGKTITKEVHL